MREDCANVFDTIFFLSDNQSFLKNKILLFADTYQCLIKNEESNFCFYLFV